MLRKCQRDARSCYKAPSMLSAGVPSRALLRMLWNMHLRRNNCKTVAVCFRYAVFVTVKRFPAMLQVYVKYQCINYKLTP